MVARVLIGAGIVALSLAPVGCAHSTIQRLPAQATTGGTVGDRDESSLITQGIWEKKLDLVRQGLAQGENPNGILVGDYSYLEYAIDEGFSQGALALIETGRLDYSKTRAVGLAAKEGHWEVLKALAKQPISIQDWNRGDPLSYASGPMNFDILNVLLADPRTDQSQCKEVCAEMRESLRSNQLVVRGVAIRDEKTGELLVFGKRPSDQPLFRSCRANERYQFIYQGRFYRIKDGADPEPVGQAYCEGQSIIMAGKVVDRARGQHHLKEPNTRPSEINYLPLTNALMEIPGYELMFTWSLYVVPCIVTLSLDVPLAAGQGVYRGVDYLKRSRFQFRRYRFTKFDGEAYQKLQAAMGRGVNPGVQYNAMELKHPRFMDLLHAVGAE